MSTFFPVILSEAKDLMPVASGDEILRFAQDDNGKHLQPTTSVSATKVFPGGRRPPAIAKSLAETAAMGAAETFDGDRAPRAQGHGASLPSARPPGGIPCEVGGLARPAPGRRTDRRLCDASTVGQRIRWPGTSRNRSALSQAHASCGSLPLEDSRAPVAGERKRRWRENRMGAGHGAESTDIPGT
jgi:hypothetical protein